MCWLRIRPTNSLFDDYRKPQSNIIPFFFLTSYPLVACSTKTTNICSFYTLDVKPAIAWLNAVYVDSVPCCYTRQGGDSAGTSTWVKTSNCLWYVRNKLLITCNYRHHTSIPQECMPSWLLMFRQSVFEHEGKVTIFCKNTPNHFGALTKSLQGQPSLASHTLHKKGCGLQDYLPPIIFLFPSYPTVRP